MPNNTTPAPIGTDDLMRLVDAYAETRHTCGDAHYNAKSKEARDAVRAALVSAIQPQTTYAPPSPNLGVAPSGPGTSAVAPKAAPPAVVEPLTSEHLQHLHHIEEFGLFCDYEEFEQIARAIEHAHGIDAAKGTNNGTR